MNKRIKQLAEQVDSEFNSPYDRHKAIERFAELIVRECAEFRNELGIALCTDPSALYRYFRVEE